MLECKTSYERQEYLADVSDNYDDPVIHISNGNEAPIVDSDNVGENIFTINIPSNFTSPSFDYRTFIQGSILKKYVSNYDFPWIYYNAADDGLQVYDL